MLQCLLSEGSLPVPGAPNSPPALRPRLCPLSPTGRAYQLCTTSCSVSQGNSPMDTHSLHPSSPEATSSAQKTRSTYLSSELSRLFTSQNLLSTCLASLPIEHIFRVYVCVSLARTLQHPVEEFVFPTSAQRTPEAGTFKALCFLVLKVSSLALPGLRTGVCWVGPEGTAL